MLEGKRWRAGEGAGRKGYNAAMVAAKPGIDAGKVAEFCRRHRIRRLALFGSILRDDFRADSDVDVLVEFEPGATPGLAFFSMQDELAELMKWKVELHTPGFLGRHFRDQVLREARNVYVAA